jgi:alkylation response protein AidB-like acyl-CoA dehydrogenase
MTVTKSQPPYLETLEAIALDVIRPAAAEIDQSGAFPCAAMNALSKSGLLGLISAPELGGLGQGPRALQWSSSGLAASVVRQRWCCVCTTLARR